MISRIGVIINWDVRPAPMMGAGSLANCGVDR